MSAFVAMLALMVISYACGAYVGRKTARPPPAFAAKADIVPGFDTLALEWQFHARVVAFEKMAVSEFGPDRAPEAAPIRHRYQWRAILACVTDEDAPPKLRAFIERKSP